MYERSSLRYAHTNGHTSLIYIDSGEFIITCGTDGDIRKWSGIDDDDPSSSCLGEFVMCIAFKDNRLLASTDRNTVQVYTFPDFDSDGVLMRFTAPATCLVVQEDFIAAGSEDTSIKVVQGSGSDAANTEKLFEGHSGPILALDLCVAKNMLASASGDGTLKIWNLETGAEIKTITGLARINSFESATCLTTPVFEPRNGNSLVYVRQKEVLVLNTSTWEIQYTLTDDTATGNYTCCQFSKDGHYLAAGTTNGEISVFDFMKRKTVKTEAPASECQGITALAWKPNNNDELAYCDKTGQLGTVFKGDGGAVNSMTGVEAAENGFGDIEFENDDLDMNGDGDMDDVQGEDDDADGVSIEKLKKKVMQSATDYGDVVNDENSKDSIANSLGDLDSNSVAAHNLVKTFKQQKPFQPSATPMDLEHRYLVWNDVGIVTMHADSADGSIDVEFHDASVHHSLHIQNYNNHNMASLSSTVLALAAEGSTKLVCIALAASGNKEWSLQMPDCESVDALAATKRLVACVTSMHFLRLFTVMGTQREVLSVPGPVIAVAGHEDRILVCYHSSPASENQQHIGAMLVQTFGLTLRTTHFTVPLPPQRQLSWVGFSDCGSPIFYDSMGLLQLYNMKSSCWYPICDTMKQSSSVSNNYFVISVSERSQIVQAVLCRGCSYPMTNPRPMLQELTLQLPLCDVDTEKAQLEETLLRASIMQADNAEKTVKETAIKLFALACRSELEMRAKELIETIGCTELLQLAVKYASKLGRIHLSERLAALMPQLEEQREERERERQETLTHNTLPMSPMLLMQQFGSPQNGSSSMANKLAPKSMDLTLVKRASLKRFSANAVTPTSFKKQTSLLESTTQDSLLDKDTEISSSTESGNLTKLSNSELGTPVNPVNPFASKRKLADMEKGAVIFGSEKLKLAKK